ncbi:MAG: phosphohistidine phosphatase SixA [Candidatus Bathyarchaeota archaeon]|nr:phosphohistidine phosphatase SixA [Candidatus Bathyarchaeota archaeon]
MKLYLVQHADSKRKEEDHTKSLSDRGWKDIRKTANYAKEHLHIKVEHIIHSGKLRAKQTAEVLAEHLNPPKAVITDPNLEPLADPKVWKKRLVEITKNTMVVGHLPHLSKLASYLLAGDENREVIAFKMAGIVCLERDQQRRWTIQWMITPDTTP